MYAVHQPAVFAQYTCLESFVSTDSCRPRNNHRCPQCEHAIGARLRLAQRLWTHLWPPRWLCTFPVSLNCVATFLPLREGGRKKHLSSDFREPSVDFMMLSPPKIFICLLAKVLTFSTSTQLCWGGSQVPRITWLSRFSLAYRTSLVILRNGMSASVKRPYYRIIVSMVLNVAIADNVGTDKTASFQGASAKDT